MEFKYLGLDSSVSNPSTTQEDWILPPAPRNNKDWMLTWEIKHDYAKDIHTASVLVALYRNFTHIHNGKETDATYIKHPVPNSGIRLDQFDVNFEETQATDVSGIAPVEQMHYCKASAEQFLLTYNTVLAASLYARRWTDKDPRSLVQTYHSLYKLVASFYYERKLLSKVGVYERNESLLQGGWPLRRYGQEVDQSIKDMAKDSVPSPTKTQDQKPKAKKSKTTGYS